MPDRIPIIVVLLFLLLHFSIILVSDVNAENHDKRRIKEWTVICYLAGDNVPG